MHSHRVYSLRQHDFKKAVALLGAILALIALSTGDRLAPPPKTETPTPITTAHREATLPTPVVLSPPLITSPQSGDTFDTDQLTITGTGPPGLSVRLSTGDRVLGTTDIQADGTWSLTLSEPLPEGDHPLTAVTTDASGQTSATSPPVTITVALAPLAEPVILWPTSGQILPDSRPTLVGTGKPGSTVRILYDGQLLGSVQVPEDGNWSFNVTEPLSAGTHTFTALAEDATGRISELSNEVIINLTRSPLTAPTLLASAREEVIQGQELPLLGTASPNATVWVFGDTQVLGTVKVGPDGRWAFRVPGTLEEGTHYLRAAVVDEDGRTSPLSSPVELRVLPRIMAAPTIISPSARVALMRGYLTLSGVAQPGATVEIYDGPIPLGATQVGTDGRWTFTVPDPLSVGEHELTAMARDDRGRISPPSQPILARVNAPPTPTPVATPTPVPVPVPVITTPAVAELQLGEVVTVTGTAPVGATVTVYDGEMPLGEVEVGADGSWLLALDEGLTEGEHRLSAVATDETGRASARSEAVAIQIVTPPPLLPVTGGECRNKLDLNSSSAVSPGSEPGPRHP